MSLIIRKYLVFAVIGILPNLFGYDVFTWQWWAVVVVLNITTHMHRHAAIEG